MTYRILIFRSLRFHARSHVGVVLGAAIAGTALTGALLVGDSVRGSLRQRALQRLANTWFALAPGERFFDRKIEEMPHPFSVSRTPIVPVPTRSILRSQSLRKADALALTGSASKPTSETRANDIQIFGIDWRFSEIAPAIYPQILRTNSVLINQPLASQLGVSQGEEIILRVQRPRGLSLEAAVAERREQTVALRATVAGIVPPEQGGSLDLKARSVPALNAFVPINVLSADVRLAGKANLRLIGPIRLSDIVWTVAKTNPPTGLAAYVSKVRKTWNRLVLHHGDPPPRSKPASTHEALKALNEELQKSWQLTDAELQLEYPPVPGAIELRTPRVFLDPPVVDAAQEIESNAVPILTYLASLISAGSNSTPYSMVTAAGPPFTPPAMADDEILVNQWLADDLKLKPGDSVQMSYFLPESGATAARQ